MNVTHPYTVTVSTKSYHPLGGPLGQCSLTMVVLLSVGSFVRNQFVVFGHYCSAKSVNCLPLDQGPFLMAGLAIYVLILFFFLGGFFLGKELGLSGCGICVI